MLYNSLANEIHNGKSLYIGSGSYLEKNKVYDVVAYVVEDPTNPTKEWGRTIHIQVLDPDKTLVYNSLEEYKADWARPLEKTRYRIEIHFSSGRSLSCDLLSSHDYDSLCVDGARFFEKNMVMDGVDVIRVNPDHVEWVAVKTNS